MLLPALNKAREKARSANCQSNLKSCAQYFAFYSQDFEDYLPPNTNQDSTGEYAVWAKHLARAGYIGDNTPTNKSYVAKNLILGCPSAKWAFNTNGMVSYRTYGSFIRASAKKYFNIVESTGTSSKWPKSDSNIIILMDSVVNDGGDNQGHQNAESEGQGATQSIHCRHAKRANTAMLDGHVESLVKDDFEPKKGGAGLNSWKYGGHSAAASSTGHVYDDI